MFLAAKRGLCEKLDFGVVSCRCTFNRNVTAQLDPRRRYERPYIRRWKGERILFVEFVQTYDALSDIVDDDGQAEEFAFRTDMTRVRDGFRSAFSVERAHRRMMRDLLGDEGHIASTRPRTWAFIHGPPLLMRCSQVESRVQQIHSNVVR